MASAEKARSTEDMREAAAFGMRLRRLRQAAGLTLKDLAERAGLAISTISKIENDRMSPTYDVLLRLARRAPGAWPARRHTRQRSAEASDGDICLRTLRHRPDPQGDGPDLCPGDGAQHR
jgi:DNA-binding XRE family transcriptional regulator